MSESTGQIGQLEFLAKVQRILSEGRFVASYKYALMLALAELSIEKTPEPDGRLRIELDELADRFITLYWRQVAPFGGNRLLAQNNGRQASIITQIALFKAAAPTLALARKKPEWPSLVRKVGRLLNQMPLWRLQLVGTERLDFLYEERLVDRSIILRPGIAESFRLHFPIVQSLIQGGWLAYVQRLPANRPLLGSATGLEEFLFGAERNGLRMVGEGLRDLQHGTCFYCGKGIGGAGAVDHFIPWSRYPVDLGHNFVLAHASCNQDKRDMLAAAGHLQRWVERNDSHGSALGRICDEARFPFDLDASLSVAEWAYENVERARALVWVGRKGQMTHLSPDWKRCFK